MWLQEVKLACHKWRVPQNIRWELPSTYHIEFGLDHTKLWYVDGQEAKPTNLPFYPMVDEIFSEMARQSNTINPVPPEAREKCTNLLIPLMDGEKVEQYEVELQMHPFMLEAQHPTTSSFEKKLDENEDDTSSESIEEDMDVLLKAIVKFDFKDP